jgi:molecular chaperone HscB
MLKRAAGAALPSRLDVAVCWSCGAAAEGALFCASCGRLQAPPGDYFAAFGIGERLSLDLTALQKSFYDLSRRLHPDRFQRGDPRERQYSLEATALLNDAWRTLRDPVERAEYVLKRHGFDIGEQRSKDIPPELLEEVFEMNMALEELRSGDDSARPQLENARRGFAAMRDELDGMLEGHFRRWDETGDRATLAEIRAILNRRSYIRNLVGVVDQALAA